MSAARQRWALSFADLCLLLLGFSLILQTRPDAGKLAQGLRGALGTAPAFAAENQAASLFEPGEAVLNGRGRALAARTAAAAGSGTVRLASRGVDTATHRFDGWELAAARAAALARAIAAAGVPERRIALSIEAAPRPGQQLVATIS